MRTLTAADQDKSMNRFTLEDLQSAAQTIAQDVPVTPAYAWPLLEKLSGVRVIVKHENHTPTGSFKARGGLVYVARLRQNGHLPKGLITATRGNHGQSIAIGAARAGIPSLIIVPEGNSSEKNAAMAAFGAELKVAGKDFDESRKFAGQLQRETGYQFVPSFHPDLVLGVATYAYELMTQHTGLDAIYVPVGMGSGICGLIGVRDMLGLKTDIIGVVSEGAPAFARSFATGKPVSTEHAKTFADGVACREPLPEAFEIMRKGASHIVTVSDDDIAEAIRNIYTSTHNVAEGAGAAAFAALMKERRRLSGRKAAVILTGGNIDMDVLSEVLRGKTPSAG